MLQQDPSCWGQEETYSAARVPLSRAGLRRTRTWVVRADGATVLPDQVHGRVIKQQQWPGEDAGGPLPAEVTAFSLAYSCCPPPASAEEGLMILSGGSANGTVADATVFHKLRRWWSAGLGRAGTTTYYPVPPNWGSSRQRRRVALPIPT